MSSSTESDTVVHGDDFVAVAEDAQLDHFKQVLEKSGRSSTGKVLWEADPKLTEKLTDMLNLRERERFFAARTSGKMTVTLIVSLSTTPMPSLSRPSRHCLQPVRPCCGPRLVLPSSTGDRQSSLDPAHRACGHCPRVSL